MWMNSRFASWEVEGEVRARVKGALDRAEQERLARAVRRPKPKRGAGSVLSTIYAGLERVGKTTACLRAEAPG